MHPLMPFLTEELWQRIPRPESRKASVAFGPYPTPDSESAARDAETESNMEMLQQVVSAGRTVRSEHGIDNKAEVPMRIRSNSPQVVSFLRGHHDAIRLLVKTAGEPVFEAQSAERERGTTVSVVPHPLGAIEVLVGLKGLVSKDEEIARIDREMSRIKKDLAAIEKKLSSPGFVDRAPPEVVEESRQQRKALLEAVERLASARKVADEL
jgi:valyl-tRNA synthetase